MKVKCVNLQVQEFFALYNTSGLLMSDRIYAKLPNDKSHTMDL